MKLCIVWHNHVGVEHVEPVDKVWKDGRVIDPHQVRVLGPESGRGLLQVVVRYFGEHVVDLVGSYVVGQAVGPAVVTVNGAQLTTNIIPFLVAVPGHILALITTFLIPYSPKEIRSAVLYPLDCSLHALHKK